MISLVDGVPQRAVQERAPPGARELGSPPRLRGLAAQPAAREGRSAGSGAHRRRESAAVHRHGLRGVPQIPRLRRGQPQVLPPLQEDPSSPHQ
jgi:hypothetical protein